MKPFAILLLLLLVPSFLLAGKKKSESKVTAEQRDYLASRVQEAAQLCQDFLRDNSADPDAMEFEESTGQWVPAVEEVPKQFHKLWEIDQNTIALRGKVWMRNQFGARLRRDWFCHARCQPNQDCRLAGGVGTSAASY